MGNNVCGHGRTPPLGGRFLPCVLGGALFVAPILSPGKGEEHIELQSYDPMLIQETTVAAATGGTSVMSPDLFYPTSTKM